MRASPVAVDRRHRRLRTLALTAALTETGGTTTLVLRQEQVDLGSLSETGPGWEWYLDRLVAVVDDDRPPTLEDFETIYAPMGAAYAAMTGWGP